MPEQVTGELKKLTDIASDMGLASELRAKAIEQVRLIGTYEALVALLGFVANEQVPVKEREFALKQAREVLKSSR